ncbi:response regulator [Chitinophagaceae bacterium LB-8]|uniref:Response regulator n=1 Tax=Paraflavisolibacter caeni TaxID=2982496 RepID=A0A9X2XZU5_9BACT|nr:response regulator [Paraflavisolibacter caeni]MCU7552694.1 response regulator [Paraflavisolibacter caeni]
MKSTILLVEDNKEMLEVLTDVLEEQYRVLTARNGQQALTQIGAEPIDLIISDVMMPIMDGFELCKIIKSNFEYSHVPIILLTAKNSIQSKIEGLELGADAYIEKPFFTDHLRVQIANLLTNRNKIKEYFAQSPVVQLKSIAHTRPDEVFLDKLNAVIQTNLDDQDLDVDKLTRLMNMSRTNLFRKIKSLTDLTPNDLVNVTRLKKAAELLAEENHKIYEISAMVGFGSQTNFGRNFLKQFGMTPTEYQKRLRTDETGQ